MHRGRWLKRRWHAQTKTTEEEKKREEKKKAKAEKVENAQKRTKRRKKREDSEEKEEGKPTSMLTKFSFFLSPASRTKCNRSVVTLQSKPEAETQSKFAWRIFFFQKRQKIGKVADFN